MPNLHKYLLPLKILFVILFLWIGTIIISSSAYGAACGGGTCEAGSPNAGDSYSTSCDAFCSQDGRTCSNDPDCYQGTVDCNIGGCPNDTPSCGNEPYEPYPVSHVVCGDWGGCYSLCYNLTPTPIPTSTPTPIPTYYRIGGRVTSSTENLLGGICISVYNDTNRQQTETCNSTSSLLTNTNGDYWIDSFIRGGDAFAVTAPSVPYTLSNITYTSKTGNYDSQTVTTNKLDYNFTYTAPIPSFDFSISPPGNISLVKGSTDPGHNITVTTTKGTPETVTLSLVGSTGRATASFSPASCTPNTSCTSILTFNTTSATAGTYSNLKVRGTTAGGTTRDSTTFTLTITAPAPTVTLSASPTSITSGTSTTLTWNISGTATSCAPSNSGTPTITSGDWTTTLTDPDVTSGTHSKPITMTTTTNGTVKTFNITCTNSGVNSSPASASVTVNTSGSPCPTATEGYSCSSSSPGTNCSLKSSYTCSVSGQSCYFCSPPPAPTISTLRVTNSCIDPNHSGSDVDISWTNTDVDWVNISTDSAFGSYYHKAVGGVLSTTAPNEFYLNPSNPPQQLTLNPDPSIYYARTYNSSQNSHSQVANFSINSCTSAIFNYSLSNSGPITLNQGTSGTNTITRTLSSGTSQPVTLSVLSGLPLGASATFTNNPSSPTSSSTLTITTSPTTPIGLYNITVSGSPLGKTTFFILTVNPSGSSGTAPDLIADSLSPVSANVNDPVTFSGRVVNKGNASAGASSARFRYALFAGGALDTTASQPTGTLNPNGPTAAGSTQTVTWTWTASGVGNHVYEICANTPASASFTESNPNNNCTFETITVNPAGTPYAPAISATPSCIDAAHSGSDVTITYGNRTPPVTWVDISSSRTFSSYYHKDVSGTTSTTAPNGFYLNPSNPPLELTLNPDPAAYYVRVSDDVQNSGAVKFSILSCSVPGPTPTPTPTPTSAPPGPKPWIQIRGDVHSNTGIR